MGNRTPTILTTAPRTVWDFRYIPSHFGPQVGQFRGQVGLGQAPMGAGMEPAPRAFQRYPKSLAHVWESIVNFGYVEWRRTGEYLD